MHGLRTHFEQIPVEKVKEIAKELPADEVIGDDAASAGKPDEAVTPQERWREVAQRVQQEEDPGKMIKLVQTLITTFDEEEQYKRLPRTQDPLNPSGEDQS